MHLNQPYQPRYDPKILLNCRHINEASKANLDAYKRIIKWQPFFEQVYGRLGIYSYVASLVSNYMCKKKNACVIFLFRSFYLRIFILNLKLKLEASVCPNQKGKTHNVLKKRPQSFQTNEGHYFQIQQSFISLLSGVVILGVGGRGFVTF